MISEILHLMPVEIAVCTGELTGELAASQKSSLVIAENNSECQCNRWLCYPLILCFSHHKDKKKLLQNSLHINHVDQSAKRSTLVY